MQELIGKINNANEAVCRSEIKVIELLEKQTKLQEESVKTDKEFLNIFKSALSNTNSSQQIL